MRTHSRAFTLIEMLVVLAILAALSALVVGMAAPGDASLAGREARRLSALLELGLSEARAGGPPMAWSAEHGGYAFWRRASDGAWERWPDDSVYRSRSLAGHAQLQEVSLDGRRVPPGERIELLRYGVGGRLEIVVAGGEARFTLQGGPAGRVLLKNDAQARLHAD